MPTYEESELSQFSGFPIEMVRFSSGTDYIYRYATGQKDQVFAGETYKRLENLDRSNPTLSPNIENKKCTFTLPSDTPVVDLWRTNPPRKTFYAILFRKHDGAADVDVISYWQGKVDGIRFKHAKRQVEIICTSLESSLKVPGLKNRYQANCRFFVFDGRCPVPIGPFRDDVVIEDVTDKVTLRSSTFALKPDGWYKFGRIETSSLDNRQIISHVGDTVTIIAPFAVNLIGETVKAIAGCDYTYETCSTKYGDYTDDGRDIGSFDLIPIDNIFERGLK